MRLFFNNNLYHLIINNNDDLDESLYKCKQIHFFPTSEQKLILDEWIELYRLMMNETIYFFRKQFFDKENINVIIEENGGTCSTKHAYLKRISEEFSMENVQLMLGIFMMNAKNTPKIKSVLEKYNLLEMPEAHNYLRVEGKILDCTRKNSSENDFINELAEEIEINPNQITDFKVQYHQEFLKKYLLQHSEIQYPLEKFWKIREECIFALQVV